MYLTSEGGAGGDLDRERVYDWNMFEKVESVYHVAYLKADKKLLTFSIVGVDDSIVDNFQLQHQEPQAPEEEALDH